MAASVSFRQDINGAISEHCYRYFIKIKNKNKIWDDLKHSVSNNIYFKFYYLLFVLEFA